MKLGISVKLAAWLSLFGLLLTGLTGYYSFSSSQQILIASAKRDLLTASLVLGRNLQLNLKAFADDALVLSRQSQPRDILLERPGRQRESDELIALFQALLEARPGYRSIRLIGIREHGLERIRVDRLGVAPAHTLAEKGHQPYVYETLELPADRQHYSQIAQHPLDPDDVLTLHLGNPIRDEQQPAIGLILLSIDVGALFQRFERELPGHYQLFLANSRGELLLHPEYNLRAPGHGPRYQLQEEVPATRELIAGRTGELLIQLPGRRQQPPRLAAFTRVVLDEHNPDSSLILGIALPQEHILRESEQLGGRMVQIVVGLGLLTLMLALMLARALTRPLGQIGHAIAQFSRNRSLHPLPTARRDELGSLARDLREMQEEILRQIGELNENRIELERLAHHDTLTGLPNRRLFFDRLSHAIANARRSGRQVGLVFVDLDHFKDINDEHGHSIGDEVLCSVARLLASITRSGDTVARLGGDEFVILFDQVEDAGALEHTAQKLLARFQNRLLIGGLELRVQASMGISLFPRDGASAEELLLNADRAMYKAKREGRNRVQLSDPDSY